MPIIKDIKIGEIHRIWFDKEDGCVDSKDKFCVCVWNCGFLFINSEHYNSPDNILISETLYSNFLNYDSYLYFGEVFEKPPNHVLHKDSYLNSLHIETAKDLVKSLQEFDKHFNIPRMY